MKSTIYYLKRFGIIFGTGFIRFLDALLEGYGWRFFLLRIFVVIVFLKLNPLDEAVHGAPAGTKLWLATWGLFFYAVGKLIFDYTKRGVKRQEAIERLRKSRSKSPDIDSIDP